MSQGGADQQRQDTACGQSGAITLKTFFLLFVMAGAVYLALLYLPPWMAYRAMLEALQDQIGTAAVASDNEISERILATAREWDVPITRDQIEIKRTDTRISISTQWDVTINLFGGQSQHVLHFAPSKETVVMPGAH